jgi:transcriptional regulator
MSTEDAVDLLTKVGIGHLVISTSQGLESAFLPFRCELRGEMDTNQPADQLVITSHIAVANPMRRLIAQADAALLIVQGPDTYISPSWYPSKAETHRVVPTWNYVIVHIHGSVRLVEDPARLRQIVTELTDSHEAERDQPWAVSDAPPEFVDAQLRAIVGVELIADRILGKAKLSQNRSEQDRAAVITMLREGDARQHAVGEMMPPP